MPKTGSTAIEERLRPESSVVLQGNAHTKHMNVREYDRLMVPLLSHLGAPKIEKCVVVRHPIDWIRSWFRYRQRDAEAAEHSTKGVKFETFVEGFVADERPKYTYYIGSQADFVTNALGEVDIEHLFRYEEFDKFKTFLEQRFTRTFEFKRLNVSPRHDTPLSASGVRLLENAFRADFELYESIG